MRSIRRADALNERGITHLLLPIIVVVIIAAIGGYVFLKIGHGATLDYEFKSGMSSKCLDVWHDGSASGTTVDLYSCNNTAAQQWNVNSNGTTNMVEDANGQCLDNWERGKANGNPIKTYRCNIADPAEQWVLTGNVLKNPETGMCVDDPAFSTTNGKPLELYTCNGGKNQTWTLTKLATGTTTGGSGSPSPTPSPTPTSTSGIITAGDSKANCISIKGGVDGEVSLTNLTAVEKTTGLTYNCLETFANPVDNWSDWEAPWQFTNEPSKTTSGSWENWLATGHQMILGVDLIPQSAPGVATGRVPIHWSGKRLALPGTTIPTPHSSPRTWCPTVLAVSLSVLALKQTAAGKPTTLAPPRLK